MKAKFKLGNLETVICSDKIEYDSDHAFIHRVHDDDEYTFDAITCAARPVEFSIVNQLYKLHKEEVKQACDDCNKSKQIGVLTTDNYHLILSPFVDRFTYFGEEQADRLTDQVIDKCIDLKVSKLRITQFCMMRSEMPYFPQFKGIIKALTTRDDSSVKLVYFDVPEKYFYELTILFKTYSIDEH
ncbi:MAG: hypothetical protein H7329_00345 [Opitutaceae bacterium]|nr:hypothetical protein [Cytophagales bacterium]